MKIYRFSRFLALPFILVLCFFAIKILQDKNYEHFALALIPIMALVLIYLFQPQLDYWWLSRTPPEIDEKVLKSLNSTNTHYKSLSEERKLEFHKRLILYIEGRVFLAKGMEQDFDVPYDVKNLIAQIPITMTLNKKDFLLDNFDRIILYKHPFPSPRFKFLHTAETHSEDGLIIIALDYAEAAFFKPTEHYNVAWHAFADAYIKTYPAEDYPITDENQWFDIENITGFKKEKILLALGFKSVDLLIVLITCYFQFPKKMKTILPVVNKSLDRIFKDN